MNILDENVLEGQRQLLLKWHVPFRQIGYEVGRKGMKDDEIIPSIGPTNQADDSHLGLLMKMLT